MDHLRNLEFSHSQHNYENSNTIAASAAASFVARRCRRCIGPADRHGERQGNNTIFLLWSAHIDLDFEWKQNGCNSPNGRIRCLARCVRLAERELEIFDFPILRVLGGYRKRHGVAVRFDEIFLRVIFLQRCGYQLWHAGAA
jgi:hypothetical protein